MCSLRIETPHMVENAAFGITVNTILPGVIETDRNAVALSNVEFAEFSSTDQAREAMFSAGKALAKTAMKYITDPDFRKEAGSAFEKKG